MSTARDTGRKRGRPLVKQTTCESKSGKVVQMHHSIFTGVNSQ